MPVDSFNGFPSLISNGDFADISNQEGMNLAGLQHLKSEFVGLQTELSAVVLQTEQLASDSLGLSESLSALAASGWKYLRADGDVFALHVETTLEKLKDTKKDAENFATSIKAIKSNTDEAVATFDAPLPLTRNVNELLNAQAQKLQSLCLRYNIQGQAVEQSKIRFQSKIPAGRALVEQVGDYLEKFPKNPSTGAIAPVVRNS
jgi:hypothetical protein